MLVDAALELLKQRVVIAARVEDDDGFEIESELFPRDDFHELLECAAASGQRNAAIAHVGDGLLALVHIAGFDEIRETRVVPVLIHHERWYDARHFSSGSKAGIGRGAHESHVSGTVDEAYAPPGQPFADGACCGEEVWMNLGA